MNELEISGLVLICCGGFLPGAYLGYVTARCGVYNQGFAEGLGAMRAAITNVVKQDNMASSEDDRNYLEETLDKATQLCEDDQQRS